MSARVTARQLQIQQDRKAAKRRRTALTESHTCELQFRDGEVTAAKVAQAKLDAEVAEAATGRS